MKYVPLLLALPVDSPKAQYLNVIFFRIYVNNITNIVPWGVVELFADDTNVLIYFHHSNTVFNEANFYIQRLDDGLLQINSVKVWIKPPIQSRAANLMIQLCQKSVLL